MKPTYLQLEKENIILREKLKKSESKDRFRNYFENNKAIMLQLNSRTKQIVNANKAAVVFYGYSKNELLKKTIDELNTLSSEEITALMKKAVENDSNIFQFKHKLANGKIRDVEVYASNLMIENTINIFVTINDITERKETELALKNNEQKYRDFVNHSPDIIYKFSNKKGGLYWSDKVFDILGFLPAEIKNNPFLWNNSIHPDDKLLVEEAIKANEKGSEYNIEYRIKTKQGRWIWLKDSFMHKSQIGDEIIIEGHASDITARKKAEQALTNSERNYRNLFEKNPLSFWNEDFTEVIKFLDEIKNNGITDYKEYFDNNPDFVIKSANAIKIIDVNQATLDLLKYKSKKELINNMINVFNEKSIETYKNQLIILAQGGKSFSAETEFICSTGEVISAIVSFEKIIDYKNIIFTITNITALKKAEQALKVSEEAYKKLFDNNPVAVWEEDWSEVKSELNKIKKQGVIINKKYLEGNPEFIFKFRPLVKIVNLNKATLNLFKFNDCNEFLKNDRNIINSKTIEIINKQFIAFFNDEKLFENETEFIDKNGKILSVIMNIQADKNYKRLIISLTNITKQKEVEAQLAIAKEKADESNRLKSSFLANMSHEIRTPMNAIIGFTEFLKNKTLEPDRRSQFIEIIQNSGSHLLNLINDIVDISKIDAGQMKVIETECKLNEFLFEIYQFFHSTASNKNEDVEIFLIKELSDGYDIIKTDKTRLRQILINIIGNAVKFTSSGSIEIKYSITNDKKIQFSVKDTGIGISEKELPIVFNRFRQADESSTRKYGGTGLGLAISKACVELLGGEIWVKSEIEKGSAFSFTIPYKSVNEFVVEELPEYNPKDIFTDKTILIVEDEPFSCLIIEEILKPTKAIILKATDGQQAIDLCKNNPKIDLVLMDIQLPILDGLKAAKEIIKIQPNLPIISQTANAMQNDRKKSIEAGCIDYITKPIKQKELISKIAKQII